MECMEGEVSALFHIFRIAFIDPHTLANLPSQDSPNLRYPPPCRSKLMLEISLASFTMGVKIDQNRDFFLQTWLEVYQTKFSPDIEHAWLLRSAVSTPPCVK